MKAFAEHFWLYSSFSLLVALAGVYMMVASRNLIRILIGMELLTKGVTLLIVLAGAVTGREALAQALVITLIVVEVVVIMVGAGLVIGAYKQHGSLDVQHLTKMKG